MRCELDGTKQPGNHRAFFVRTGAVSDFFAFPILCCRAVWTRLLLLGIILSGLVRSPRFHRANLSHGGVSHEPCWVL